MVEPKYLLRQPTTLESMAVKKLAQWIVTLGDNLAPSMNIIEQRYPTKAQELLSRQIKIIRNWIECRLPGRFHDEVMTELKHTLSYRLIKVQRGDILNTILGPMIETLFNKNITSLLFKDPDGEHFGDSFYSKSSLIPGLIHLTLQNYCTNDVLTHVEKSFKLIKTLDLSDSDIDNDCISILIRMSHLKSVNLTSTGVTEPGIGMLLTSCPNIEHIVTTKEIGCVLENNINLENHDGRRFNIKSYINRYGATFEQLQLVVKMCPSIEKVQLVMYIGEYYENPEKYLNILQDLQSLSELELFNCDFYSYQVKELLQARGSNLVYLHFWCITDIDSSALKHVCITCPNLQVLDLYRCEYTDTEEMSPKGNNLCRKVITSYQLIYLKKISVTGSYHSQTEENIIFFLSICPNIEYIDIHGLVIHDIDYFMLRVLERNETKWKYLRELRIRGEKLSKAVIDQIVQNCVNHLEIWSELLYYS